jgi:low affinity Fe/Cu permease
MKAVTMQQVFRELSVRANRLSGAPAAFAGALAVILIWALTGPIFHFSDTWQLLANTGTTLVTFLMMFLVNGAQNASAALAQAQQDRIESMERTLDEHVNTTAKQHTEELHANTVLTREIHQMVSAKPPVEAKKAG